MSLALYGIESLRFYTEKEIMLRNILTEMISNTVKTSLTNLNQSWKFKRVEGPTLTPRNFVSGSYDKDDIFITQIKKANQELVLRPETTISSYLFAKENFNLKQLPLCVWQLGKSYRVEKSDGATAIKLRFHEFYQLEFQCIYNITTKADYRTAVIWDLVRELKMFFGGIELRVIESDRLPAYSESTLDIEMLLENGNWKEIASCSIRKDFSDETRVCEIAMGMDRLTEIYGLNTALNSI